MNQKQAAYERYMQQFSCQSNPEVYGGGYGKNPIEIFEMKHTAIRARDVMDVGVCMGAFSLPDGRAVEERQTEYGQFRYFVFESVDAYNRYIKPMSFNQYHEQ